MAGLDYRLIDENWFAQQAEQQEEDQQ